MQTITITAMTPQKFDFIENSKLRSVAQNIALICSTKKGTVPFYREFGIPMAFIDKPSSIARTLMIAEITEAVEHFETRAEIKNITFYQEGEKCYPKLEVELIDE